MKSTSKKLETEGNEDRKSFYMDFWRNKFMANYSQKKSKNKHDHYKLMYFNGNNNNNNKTINPKIYNYDTYNINIWHFEF